MKFKIFFTYYFTNRSTVKTCSRVIVSLISNDCECWNDGNFFFHNKEQKNSSAKSTKNLSNPDVQAWKKYIIRRFQGYCKKQTGNWRGLLNWWFLSDNCWEKKKLAPNGNDFWEYSRSWKYDVICYCRHVLHLQLGMIITSNKFFWFLRILRIKLQSPAN